MSRAVSITFVDGKKLFVSNP